jgi:DNA-directed RNA polymerase subunit alpha
MEMILSIRQLRFAAQGDGPFNLELSVSGKGNITGADFKGGNIEVTNRKLHIAEITKSATKLDITMVVEKGTGYSPSEDRERKEIGMIPLDSTFTPVLKCNFRVEGARVGRVSNFDKLILEIWTDQTIDPQDALKHSSDILSDFYGYLLSGKDRKVEVEDKQDDLKLKADDKVFDTIIDELDLPTRVINALLRDGIETVGDLVKRGRESLVDLKGVGRKSIDLIDNELVKLGVEFVGDEKE